jgi:TonB family protein
MMRNSRDKNLFIAIFVSISAHLLFFLIIFLPFNLSSTTERRERVIVTRLVALGVPRNEKVMPRLTGESAAPKKEVVISTEGDEKIEKSRKVEEKRREDEFSKRLLSSINKVKRMVESRDNSPPVGDPNGSPFGDSTEVQEGDIYLTEVYNRIKSNYIIPDIINEKERKELRAVVVIYLDSDGRVIKYEFEKKSGNTHFDNALINAIKRSSPFKPPPKERAKIYRTEGIGINFGIE